MLGVGGFVVGDGVLVASMSLETGVGVHEIRAYSSRSCRARGAEVGRIMPVGGLMVGVDVALRAPTRASTTAGFPDSSSGSSVEDVEVEAAMSAYESLLVFVPFALSFSLLCSPLTMLVSLPSTTVVSFCFPFELMSCLRSIPAVSNLSLLPPRIPRNFGLINSSRGSG